MRSDVSPFLWFVAAVLFAVIWRGQHHAVFLILAVLCAIRAVRSYKATKKARP